ncbi:hypothetical protein OG742_04035 [Streptomyces sp. NBC_00828]|uniref:hypothetical protein n=1 Tax=Streptomyces sp. NBC_00828 TaxID=2903678 RepID=UPI00386B54FA
MREIADAAVTFPAVTFTTALLVVAGFWLLVLLGRAERDGFDSDADTNALGMGDLPVAATASLVIALAWISSLVGSVLLHRSEVSGLLHALLAVAVFVVSLALAYAATRTVAQARRRLRSSIRDPGGTPPARPGAGRADTTHRRPEP